MRVSLSLSTAVCVLEREKECPRDWECVITVNVALLAFAGVNSYTFFWASVIRDWK